MEHPPQDRPLSILMQRRAEGETLGAWEALRAQLTDA